MWTTDRIHNGLGDQAFMSFKPTGRYAGKYIRIEPDGLATQGTYTDACPHPTDGLFTVVRTRQFDSIDDALESMVHALGIDLLVGMFR